MKIKVCGMKDAQNVRNAAELGIDMIGFIFYPLSKRYVGDQEVIPTSRVLRVGVFVDESLSQIAERAETWNLDALQLHGSESPEFCRILGSLGLPLVKAFSVDEDFDFGELDPYKEVVDFFLFDTKGKYPGGNGYRFDWRLLDDYKLAVPFWLSGGIGPGLAEEIKKLRHPGLYAVDLNSRFEDEPGMKNIEKLKTFVDELQN